MLANIISSFKTCINESLDKIQNFLTSNGNTIIFFKEVVYYTSYLLGNNVSFDIVNSHLKIHDIADVSKKCIVQAKNNIDIECYERFNNYLLDHIYSEINGRMIAVDGSNVHLLKSLNKDGFKFADTNNNTCRGLISTLFDVDREIPINYNLVCHTNERLALMEQIHHLKENDILIMDRGYYSRNLLLHLNKHDLQVIFRLRNNFGRAKSLMKSLVNVEKRITIKSPNGPIKFRLIKYIIEENEQTYLLGTTILDKPIEYFIKYYRKRWKIEIHFRYSKYNLSLSELHSTTKNGIIQDIFIHQFIFIVASYCKYIMEYDLDKTKETIHTANALHITINELLYLLIYKDSTEATIDEIKRILIIMHNVRVPIRANRHYDRKKISHSTKWGPYGIKYNMAH
jgi:hypothetical protein